MGNWEKDRESEASGGGRGQLRQLSAFLYPLGSALGQLYRWRRRQPASHDMMLHPTWTQHLHAAWPGVQDGSSRLRGHPKSGEEFFTKNLKPFGEGSGLGGGERKPFSFCLLTP